MPLPIVPIRTLDRFLNHLTFSDDFSAGVNPGWFPSGCGLASLLVTGARQLLQFIGEFASSCNSFFNNFRYSFVPALKAENVCQIIFAVLN